MAILKPALLLLLGLVFTSPGVAQMPNENALRAALVYNLMLFVDWPEATSGNADLLLCAVLENPESARAFAMLDGKPVKARTLRVQRRGPLSPLDGCDAVYLNGMGEDLLVRKLQSLGNKPVLTVTSTPATGAMIHLARAGNKLVFDVYANTMRNAGLSLAPRVMQLAHAVHR